MGGTTTLLGVMVAQFSPVGTVSVSWTVPLNAPVAVIVIVEVVDVLIVTAAGAVAAIVKSPPKVNVAVVL